MSLYIPKMSDTPAITIQGLADNFGLLAGSQIVEQGSNENGEYVRWENGLQICFRTHFFTEGSFNPDGSVFRFNAGSLSMPAAFSRILFQSATMGGGVPNAVRNSAWFGKLGYGSTGTGTSNTYWSGLAFWSGVNITIESLAVHLFAIGWWK